MKSKKRFLKNLLPVLGLLAGIQTLSAQSQPASTNSASATAPVSAAQAQSAVDFNETADKALLAMKQRAEELNIKGVALVAYSEGDTVQAWSSKMVVVGHLAGPPSKNDPNGSNLLGIAYTKAAEMADTLKDSGSKIRPPKTGEYGWQGGVVVRGKTGILIAAFSGGPSASDLKVSKTGLAILAEKL